MNYQLSSLHPEYRQRLPEWRHCAEAYAGGRRYLDRALIRHLSEIEAEFEERRRRACYFNYPRAIAQRITQYALSVDPTRRGGDPALIDDWSGDGLRTNEVMRQLSTQLTLFGRGWLLAEMPFFAGTPSVLEARAARLRPYVRAVPPLQVADWAADEADGRLLWAIVLEEKFHHPDPESPGIRRHYRRIYRRDSWELWELDGAGGRLAAAGSNPLGEVPLLPVTEPDSGGDGGSHWFEDAVRISEAILNNESEAQMNIVKQMFGMLVVGESFGRRARQYTRESDSGGFCAAVARSAAVIESAEEKGISRYISPSGVANEAIRAENRALKEELYDVVGLAAGRESRDRQSAESKAWDFQNVSQFLSARVELLERAEVQAWKLMQLYDPAIPVPEVHYNRKFSVNDLSTSISGLLQLSGLPAGNGYRRAVTRAAAELLDAIEPLSPEDKAAIQREIR